MDTGWRLWYPLPGITAIGWTVFASWVRHHSRLYKSSREESRSYPPILCVITGTGPLRDYYQALFKQSHFHFVHIYTAYFYFLSLFPEHLVGWVSVTMLVSWAALILVSRFILVPVAWTFLWRSSTCLVPLSPYNFLPYGKCQCRSVPRISQLFPSWFKTLRTVTHLILQMNYASCYIRLWMISFQMVRFFQLFEKAFSPSWYAILHVCDSPLGIEMVKELESKCKTIVHIVLQYIMYSHCFLLHFWFVACGTEGRAVGCSGHNGASASISCSR